MFNSPGRQIVILVREAGRAAFNLDARKCLFRFIVIPDIFVITGLACSIHNGSSMENAWANSQAALDA